MHRGDRAEGARSAPSPAAARAARRRRDRAQPGERRAAPVQALDDHARRSQHDEGVEQRDPGERERGGQRQRVDRSAALPAPGRASRAASRASAPASPASASVSATPSSAVAERNARAASASAVEDEAQAGGGGARRAGPRPCAGGDRRERAERRGLLARAG